MTGPHSGRLEAKGRPRAEGHPTGGPCSAHPAPAERTRGESERWRRRRLANQPDGERSCVPDREATGNNARNAEPLDRLEVAVVFAMREAKRLHRKQEGQPGNPKVGGQS